MREKQINIRLSESEWKKILKMIVAIINEENKTISTVKGIRILLLRYYDILYPVSETFPEEKPDISQPISETIKEDSQEKPTYNHSKEDMPIDYSFSDIKW